MIMMMIIYTPGEAFDMASCRTPEITMITMITIMTMTRCRSESDRLRRVSAMC